MCETRNQPSERENKNWGIKYMLLNKILVKWGVKSWNQNKKLKSRNNWRWIKWQDIKEFFDAEKLKQKKVLPT